MKSRNKNAILGAIRAEQSITPSTRADSRIHHRHTPTHAESLVNFEHPGGSKSSCHAFIIDLSTSGTSIATRCFLHKGTQVTLRIKTNDGELIIAHGSVQWCKYFGDQVHTSGISFTEKIDPKDFIPEASWSNCADTNDKAIWEIKRSALIIDDDPLSTSVLEMLLSNANIAPTNTDSIGSALDYVQQQQYDILLISDTLNSDISTEDAIQTLQSHGYSGPLIVDTNALGTRQQTLIDAGATSALQRPIQLSALMTQLREAFEDAVDPSHGSFPIRSSLSVHQCSNQTLNDYIKLIVLSSQKLDNCIANDLYENAIILCNSIHSSGSGFGFPLLSSTAATVIKSLNASNSAKESAVQIRNLIRLIGRIEPR